MTLQEDFIKIIFKNKKELERNVKNFSLKFLYCISEILLTTYKTQIFIEDKITNKLKNANAFQNIKNGEIWREYKDIYTNTLYCDWIVLNSTKEKIIVSNIENHTKLEIKEVEPRIIYEFWQKC